MFIFKNSTITFFGDIFIKNIFWILQFQPSIMVALLMIFSIKILLFIFFINFSRKVASSLFEQLKRRTNSQSLAIFVNESE
jgi:hypothetical protein